MEKLSLSLPKFTFLREVIKEMKLVTWPSFKSTAIFTTLIIVFTVIFSYFISIVDLGFVEGLGELRQWLGGKTAQSTELNPPTVTGGTILDSNGNEVQVKNILTNDQIKKAISPTE